jgi:GTP-binding protein
MRAGKGGDGVVSWHHEHSKEYGGPDGGNGGKGGDVYAEAVRDIGILAKERFEKEFAAEDGENGRGWSQQGASGEDIYVKLPVGSVVTNLSTGQQIELLSEGEKILVLKGGRGGLGNEHFKASTNVTPKEWTPGKEGEEADFHVELRLVADVGFVGLPNAGKSSLLNALTRAQAKVGSYQFTTLEPNLGEMHGFILADIPGLIEGASEGKGLGDKFLRHITRTRTILHCISVENEDVASVYDTIRTELKKHGEGLDEKEELIVLTKTDETTLEDLEKKIKILKKKNPRVTSVTILDDGSVTAFKNELIKLLQKK